MEKFLLVLYGIVYVFSLIYEIKYYFFDHKKIEPKKMCLIDIDESNSIFGQLNIGFIFSWLFLLIALYALVIFLPFCELFQVLTHKPLGLGKIITYVFKDENDEVFSLKARSSYLWLLHLKDVRIGDICDVKYKGTNILKVKVLKEERYK